MYYDNVKLRINSIRQLSKFLILCGIILIILEELHIAEWIINFVFKFVKIYYLIPHLSHAERGMKIVLLSIYEGLMLLPICSIKKLVSFIVKCYNNQDSNDLNEK